MQQLANLTTIPAIDGDIQVVRSTHGLVLLDVQGIETGTDGHYRLNHGLVRLSYQAACDLRNVLDQIAEPVDEHQHALPAIRRNASFTLPVPARSARPRRRTVA